MPLSRGPRDLPFLFSHANRHDQAMLKELGAAIMNMVSVPGGIVCFMATYSLLHAALEVWMADGWWQRLSAKRRPFYETRDGDVNAFETYRQSNLSGQPAILFAVIGGRLSEGINFSDDLCRLLIVVGIPYANSQEAEMAERISYYRSRHSDSSKFLENLAMRAVNQTVGRAIRHAYDHAAIVLIDERYCRLKHQLPGWIQRSFEEADSFGVLYRRLIQVMAHLIIL